jgi:hypothetical protein
MVDFRKLKALTPAERRLMKTAAEPKAQNASASVSRRSLPGYRLSPIRCPDLRAGRPHRPRFPKSSSGNITNR